jgi:archaemetzincin
MNISIIAVGPVKAQDLTYLAKQLEAKFDSCDLIDQMDMPSVAYNAMRCQYMASLVLQSIMEAYAVMPADTRVLGVTEADLYAPGLEHVVGQALWQYAVLSLRRLLCKEVEVFRGRMVKEAVHEIGHTIGLKHCQDRLCVMHYSQYVNGIDAKGDRFCSRCVAKLRHIYTGNSMDVAVG